MSPQKHASSSDWTRFTTAPKPTENSAFKPPSSSLELFESIGSAKDHNPHEKTTLWSDATGGDAEIPSHVLLSFDVARRQVSEPRSLRLQYRVAKLHRGLVDGQGMPNSRTTGL